LGEEHGLRVFENRVLRKIFGPKREEDGSWRKLPFNCLKMWYRWNKNWRLRRFKKGKRKVVPVLN
jgi:hypothetical protein